jgi:hypothetical protein
LNTDELRDDVLRGADKVAEFLYGEPKKRRRVYFLVEQSGLPVFRDGNIICARKSRLLAWIAEQEQQSYKARPTAPDMSAYHGVDPRGRRR